MQKLIVASLALAVSASFSFTVSSANANARQGASHAFAAAMQVPAHDQSGVATFDALPGYFRHGTARAGRALVDARLHGAAALAGQSLAGDVAWVWGSALNHPFMADRMRGQFLAGLPVLVMRNGLQGELDDAMHAVFGASSPAEIAVYRLSGDGSLRVFSVDVAPGAEGDLSPVIGRLLGDVRNMFVPRRAMAGDDTSERHALPKVQVTNTQYASSIDGASTTIEATVVRHSTTSRNVLKVLSRATYNLKPAHNGMTGGALVIPRRYATTTALQLDGSGPPYSSALIEQFPRTDARTDIVFNESKTTTTSYGFNISPEVSAGLQGPVPSASAKVSYGFTFGREYSNTQQIQFTTKDYFFSSRASVPMANKSAAGWDFDLAPAIAANAEYFGKSPSAAKVTPMMRSAAPQTFAAWEIDGSYSGLIGLSATAVITNASFNGKRIDEIPDPRYQATAFVSIKADSPYLTAVTTVFIQSQKGDGLCLWRDRNEAVMKTCPDTSRAGWEAQTAAQWQLDTEGRYFNREAKQCLQMLPAGSAPVGGGHLILGQCTLAASQRWEWRADRIYTLYDGASQEWRLHVDSGDVPLVRIDDPAKHQDLPVNPHHALLIPWSTYPVKPVKGVYIPSFTTNQPAIPEDWLRFNAVTSDQVWRVIPLRQSLMQ
jgi:hypothetical protein